METNISYMLDEEQVAKKIISRFYGDGEVYILDFMVRISKHEIVLDI